VQQGGGHVTVQTELGVGTTFKVYLPTTDELAAGAPAEAPSQPPSTAASVLLLEDEDGVRRLVTKVLEKRGYLVHAAGHPNDALTLARRRDLRIDLLLTDVVMPEMTGREVADAVCAIHPRCRVVFMSGYTDDAAVRHGVMNAGAMFIQKPFRADDLAQKVAEALADRAA
jgi:DNA-binding NtrC family response regulator